MADGVKYEYEFQTRAYELDMNGALKPSQMFQYLQETAEHQLREQDLDYVEMYKTERKAFILSRMGVEIYRPLYRHAKVKTHTWISEGKAANFPRSYDMFCDGEPVAKSFSNWALVNVDTKKLIKNKDYDTGAYPHGEPAELEIPARFRLPKEIDFHKVQDVGVGYSTTDINRHMNNAMYLNYFYDHIPNVENRFITSINIRFLHEAPLGEKFTIFMSDPQEPDDLDPRADEVIYFYTEAAENINVEAVFGFREI